MYSMTLCFEICAEGISLSINKNSITCICTASVRAVIGHPNVQKCNTAITGYQIPYCLAHISRSKTILQLATAINYLVTASK